MSPARRLSCVIIDKLPFAAPDDPVLDARLTALRETGGNPFFDWQVPAAVIALKQGAGRLIRDVADRGVLMLCDPRLTSRAYGKLFLKSLPPMPITRELGDVQDFFSSRERRRSAGRESLSQRGPHPSLPPQAEEGEVG